MTRRDLQAAAKAQGKPWDLGKGADASAPVSALRPVGRVGHPARGAIRLTVNGRVRQSGDLSMMSWSVAEIIANLSGFVALAPGDLIFTGTPAGVGPVARGDRLLGEIEGLGRLEVSVE
jgi:fumarylpyruvate hydrolase